jgi:hypothetical protein
MNRRTPVSNPEPFINAGMMRAQRKETRYTTISTIAIISILYTRPLERGTCILSRIRQGMATFTRSDESPDAPLRVIYPIRKAKKPTPIRIKRVQILVATGRKSISCTFL